MKLTLSALLVLGFSQFCAAAAAKQDEMRVDVFIPERLGDPYLACFDISDCGYPCVPLSFDGESVNPSVPTKSLCMGESSVRAPTLTAYATLDDGNTLDHLRVSGYPLDIKCRRGEDFQNGSAYYCGVNIGQDSTTTTTTTTTAAAITTTTIATTKTADATTTAIATPICSNKSAFFGKARGDGYNGDCCKTQADCKEECIKGKCNGPKRVTTKSSSTTKAPSTTKKNTTTKTTQTPSVCKAGYRGKKKGNGIKGACCSTQKDCKEDCIKGKCN